MNHESVQKEPVCRVRNHPHTRGISRRVRAGSSTMEDLPRNRRQPCRLPTHRRRSRVPWDCSSRTDDRNRMSGHLNHNPTKTDPFRPGRALRQVHLSPPENRKNNSTTHAKQPRQDRTPLPNHIQRLPDHGTRESHNLIASKPIGYEAPSDNHGLTRSPDASQKRCRSGSDLF